MHFRAEIVVHRALLIEPQADGPHTLISRRGGTIVQGACTIRDVPYLHLLRILYDAES